ncbi:hypothetical protein B1812_18290 [Methylocystis bryophila]|uniref:Plastocyanin-like domain-containing protein n=1 Tax=Methylocystis bryophila TaxID=655015 RepID=A0A1W6MYU8_9HYPH|nr:hypothetical protein B1812_18290 [Methylocystis bryophila]
MRVENELSEPSLVHWHGMTPPWREDGAPFVSAPPIPPGGKADYDFPLTFGGTYWMHSLWNRGKAQLHGGDAGDAKVNSLFSARMRYPSAGAATKASAKSETACTKVPPHDLAPFRNHPRRLRLRCRELRRAAAQAHSGFRQLLRNRAQPPGGGGGRSALRLH